MSDVKRRTFGCVVLHHIPCAMWLQSLLVTVAKRANCLTCVALSQFSEEASVLGNIE
jgi:hypothetical protein